VVFQVFVDGAKAYDSGVTRWADGPKSVNVSVAGKSTLRLVVTDAGDGTAYDYADWASARLTGTGTGTTAPPTTPSTTAPGATTTTTQPPGGGGTTYVSDLTPTQTSNG